MVSPLTSDQAVVGTAEAGSTVTLTFGATTLGSVVATDGTWSYMLTPANVGTIGEGAGKTVIATTRDVAGNTSDPTTSSPFGVDTVPPTPPTIVADIIDPTDPTITGATEVGTTVTLSFEGTVLGNATVDGSGNWTYTLTGPNFTTIGVGIGKVITATASDPGGTATTDVTVIATCYAAGTRIATPQGEVAVEDMRVSNLVMTVSGRTQPIVWIGHRHVDFRNHPNRQRILPVRITAHAFGQGLPKRDLLLSPDHLVFVDDVLIPIRHLVNGSSITQIERNTITYYHVELPRHDVLLAEGLPAESYLDAGARGAFANHDGVVQLHPDFASPREDWAMLWEVRGYAPLVVFGEKLERTRRELCRQADMLALGNSQRTKPKRRAAKIAA